MTLGYARFLGHLRPSRPRFRNVCKMSTLAVRPSAGQKRIQFCDDEAEAGTALQTWLDRKRRHGYVLKRQARSVLRECKGRGLLKPPRGSNAAQDYDPAAIFSFDNARIFTRMLAGFAAPLIISPVAGLRTSVPALRAGTLRKPTFRSPGRTNSPTPRG